MVQTPPTEGDSPVLLARRADFTLGNATVRPSLRIVEGPAGQVSVEPRVMQVLIALADAEGGVLSRDDLLQQCWQGRIVGDDAINRAIAEARRTSEATGASFRIETITRVGYRLDVRPGRADAGGNGAAGPARSTRRNVLALSAVGAAAIAAGGYGAFAWQRSRRASALLAKGKQVFERRESIASARTAARLFEQAIAIDPDLAEAWGMLSAAFAFEIENAPAGEPPPLAARAQSAAERALALDPTDPNARTSLAVLRRGLDDWIAFERELVTVLRDFPSNHFALTCLTVFCQAVGRCRESLAFSDRALAVEPMSPSTRFRQALKLWIFNRNAEADRVSGRALELWPRHALVWNTRVTILAFTGRPVAAVRMIEDEASRPAIGPAAIEVWLAGLSALQSGSQGDIGRVRSAALQSVNEEPGAGVNAVLLLSVLGDVDGAYEIAESLALRKEVRAATERATSSPESFYAPPGWRETQWLFTPATKALRESPRFTRFCEELGYVNYWRARGIWPDPFMRGSIRPS